jgi:hypothetical protein
MSINVGSRLYNGWLSPTSSVTAIQLGSSQALHFGVTVLAKSTNTGVIYVGNSGVTTSNGFPLAAGAGLDLAINNLDKIYIVGSGTVQYIGG